jgi:DNA-binding beta-propeller fold protein YncE
MSTQASVNSQGPKRIKLVDLIIFLLILIIFALLGFGWLFFSRVNPVDQIAPKLISTSTPPKYQFSITGNSGGGGLNKPLAVATDKLGRIYVADTGNGVIKVFDSNGQYLSTFGKEQLKFPFQLTFSGGQLWVADPTLRQVQVFDTDGTLAKTFAKSPKATDPNTKEEFIPVAVSISDSGEVYIIDTANQVIKVFDKGGKELRKIGHPGNDQGGLSYANALWVSDQKVYVSDSNNARLQIFDTTGKYLQTLDASGSKTGPISYPRGILVTSRGQILLVDVFMQMVRAFNQKGEELWTLGTLGTNNNEFNFPNGLWLDNSGKLYVTDRENNRVQVFKF